MEGKENTEILASDTVILITPNRNNTYVEFQFPLSSNVTKD